MELRVCTTCRQVHPGLTTCPACGSALSLADERLFLGDTFGKYRLEAVLGAGGMGVVYRAIHGTLNRPAAVKVVLPRLDDELFRKRFLREAQILAELKHPNIVEVYDFDVSAWGSPYYVMELLEGATVGTLVRGGPLAPASIAAILSDVRAGLAFAHRKGVVHRDLKPDNLFVATFDERAVTKVLDFGIAKLLASADRETTHLTGDGVVVGTPNYLAPEQILGGDIGPWTDQYALALIVGELLRGKPLRAGKTLGEIIRVEITRPLAAELLPPDVPAATRAALQRATSPRPADRYADVASFAAALHLPRPAPASVLTSAIEASARQATVQAAVDPMPVTLGLPAAADVGVAGPESTELIPATLDAHQGTAPATPRRWPIAALGALVLAGASWWWLGRSATGTTAPTRAAARHESITLVRAIAVPPDVKGVLASNAEVLVLEGGQALYLLPRDGSQAPTRIALADTAEVLGPTRAGGVWLQEADRIDELDPVSQKRLPLLDQVPAMEPMEDRASPRVVVSPSGRRLALVQPGRIDVYTIGGRKARHVHSVTWDPAAEMRLRLTDKYLVVSQGLREVAAYGLDGARVYVAPLGEQRVLSLAVLDDLDLLAIGGWFDHVDVHSLRTSRAPRRIAARGVTTSVAWIADTPTLVIGGDQGLAVWRQGTAQPVAWGKGTHQADDLLAAGSALLSLDTRARSVAVLAYATLPPPRRVALGNGQIWALLAEGKRLFAGSSDGVLHVHDTATGRTDTRAVHSAGITDLARHGALLGSTSDDRTIAVWDLASVAVTYRSKAHAFLVNQMFLQGDPASLWSASSDGTLKRWAWPQLEELESVDASRLAGRKQSLHALWVDPSGERVLAGTWNHALLALRKQGGTWSLRSTPVESQVLYRFVHLPAVDAVLMVALHPHAVHVYDLANDRLHRLRSFDHLVYAAVPAGDGSSAWVMGDGAVLAYGLARGAGGVLAYTAAARADTTLGVITAAAVDDEGLVAGTATGHLLRLDREALPTSSLVEETLGPDPR